MSSCLKGEVEMGASIYMCVHMYTRMSICMYAYEYMYVCVCICLCAHPQIHTHFVFCTSFTEKASARAALEGKFKPISNIFPDSSVGG